MALWLRNVAVLALTAAACTRDKSDSSAFAVADAAHDSVDAASLDTFDTLDAAETSLADATPPDTPPSDLPSGTAADLAPDLALPELPPAGKKDAQGPLLVAVGWQQEAFDLGSGPDGDLTLAIAAGAKLHVLSYTDAKDLRYVLKSGGNLQPVETVHKGGDTGDRNALALAPDGTPHATWRDYTAGKLFYATRKGDNLWSQPLKLLDGSGLGLDSDIAVDGAGKLHVTAHDYSGGKLVYFSNASGAWTQETLDDKDDPGYANAIAVSQDGQVVHAACFADKTDALVSLRKVAGKPVERAVVDTEGSPGTRVDLALDASGNPHIAYYVEKLGDLYYATVAAGDVAAGGWALELVDGEGNDAGDALAIALGKDQTPWIAYRHYGAGELRLAHRVGGVWQRIPLFKGSVGKGVGVQIEADGTVHVAFQNWSDKKIGHFWGN